MAGTALLFTLSALASALPDPNSFRDLLKGPPGTQFLFSVQVDSQAPQGTSFDLAGGEYVLISSGFYRYAGAVGSFKADVECSTVLASGSPTGSSPTWVRNQYPNVQPSGDHLDMYVDGKAVDWSPVNGAVRQVPVGGTPAFESPECDSSNQDSATHPYRSALNWRGGALNLKIVDDDYTNNAGTIQISVYRILERSKEELIAVIPIPAASSEGIYTPHLVVGHTYRLEVSGSYEFATQRNFIADVECSRIPLDPTWREKFVYPGVINANDLLDLHVIDPDPRNGVADGDVSWRPLSSPSTPGKCATDVNKTYDYIYEARDPQQGTADRRVTRLNLRINDGSNLDNKGVLTLKLYDLNPTRDVSLPSAPGIDPASPPDPSVLGPTLDQGTKTADGALPQPAPLPCVLDAAGACLTVEVDSTRQTATLTRVPVAPGTYRLEVSGTYAYASGVLADAECSKGPSLILTGDPTWQRNRYPHVNVGRDHLDLIVNETDVEWAPKGSKNPTGCQESSNSAEHIYTTDFTWAPSGGSAPMPFRIADAEFTTNSGKLLVKILGPIPAGSGPGEQPMAVIAVNSADPVGSLTPVLVQGKRYRLEVSGTYVYYSYSSGGFNADAECTTKGNFVFGNPKMDAAGWQPYRFGGDDPTKSDYPNDSQDLYVDDLASDNYFLDGPVTWTPKTPASGTSSPACAGDSSRTYTYEFVADLTSPLNLRIYEGQTDWYMDNTGVLTVKIFLLS